MELPQLMEETRERYDKLLRMKEQYETALKNIQDELRRLEGEMRLISYMMEQQAKEGEDDDVQSD